MSIVGIGTDIVEIARIASLLEHQCERFTQRILHPNELICLPQIRQPAAWLAKRFATKEALAKALGTGIGQYAQLAEIETIYTHLGKPHLLLHGVTLQTANELGVTHIELSVADERAYAVAFVILQRIL